MEDHKFDRISRSLAGATSRRQASRSVPTRIRMTYPHPTAARERARARSYHAASDRRLCPREPGARVHAHSQKTGCKMKSVELAYDRLHDAVKTRRRAHEERKRGWPSSCSE